MKYGKRVCGNIGQIEMDDVEATDLDDLVDFMRAEALIKGELVDLQPETASRE